MQFDHWFWKNLILSPWDNFFEKQYKQFEYYEVTYSKIVQDSNSEKIGVISDPLGKNLEID